MIRWQYLHGVSDPTLVDPETWEHDVALVMRVCEHLSVLDFGQVIATGTPEQVRSNEAVLAAYLGTAPDAVSGGEQR